MLSTVPVNAAEGLERPVTEISHSGYLALPVDAPLDAVARAMAEKKIHAVLVTDPANGPVGWVTSHGMLHNHPRDWGSGATAGDAITEPVMGVPPTATIGDAIQAFVASGASHIVVTSPSGQPLGVVADSDLVAFMAATHPAR